MRAVCRNTDNNEYGFVQFSSMAPRVGKCHKFVFFITTENQVSTSEETQQLFMRILQLKNHTCL